MANIIHVRCLRCGETLRNRQEPYCQPCNLFLAYRALPLLLGMALTGHLAAESASPVPADIEDSEDTLIDETANLVWE